MAGSKMKISDSAVVFLGTDSLSPQLTTTHKHLTVTEGTDEIVGIPVPEGWAPPFGAYIAASFLTYNANGGSDAPGQVIVLTGGKRCCSRRYRHELYGIRVRQMGY